MRIDRGIFAQTIMKSAKNSYKCKLYFISSFSHWIAYNITKRYWIQKHKLIDVKLM